MTLYYDTDNYDIRFVVDEFPECWDLHNYALCRIEH